MNSFGFSFGFGPRDDDENNRDNNNPFGGFSGGIGDVLNEFGQMLSGLGSSMNSPDGAGPVNYAVAERIARQQIGKTPHVTASEEKAVADTVHLVELWLNDATYLPASENTVAAWNAEDWFNNTLPTWKRMVTPVAQQMNQAKIDSMPEEAREMMGPILGMMDRMASMNFGLQLGNALGDLAVQSLSGSDFGIQLAPNHTTALLPAAVARISEEVGVSHQDVLVYLAAREAARQRLFRHVPWLTERLISSVEEYAAGLEIDTSAMEEAMRSLNIESQDPAAIQDAMAQLQDMNLEPTIRSRNEGATIRLETLLALIEGWVELVVTEAMGDRVPATAKLNEAWRRRRATGGSAERAFSSVVGIEFAAPKVNEATELWRRITVAVGTKRRDQVWDHPDFLPSAEHLENSAEFIDTLLDDSDTSTFDPIAEITALEEMLAQQPEHDHKENPVSDTDTDTSKKEKDTSESDEAPDNDAS
ncbi:putative hydrolase [Corynebacterium mustelae]|uniref:Putative hydrolase n=1 Tax=Corynebacterium mustelae TaxID=571915 RepID=A0A0G3GVI0_9CORY|nr:zinc-dependent metalloprotease [Corynebacterium mustelae]AKK05156.1 putative hydrolase [Corynebacterium mustelae]